MPQAHPYAYPINGTAGARLLAMVSGSGLLYTDMRNEMAVLPPLLKQNDVAQRALDKESEHLTSSSRPAILLWSPVM